MHKLNFARLSVVTVLIGVVSVVAAPKSQPTATSYTAHIGPRLQTKLSTLNVTDSAGVVIVTFNTATGLSGIHDLDTPITGLLARNGIATVGHRFQTLGIISAVLTKAQVTS